MTADHPLRVRRLTHRLAVCRLAPDVPVAPWMCAGVVWSVTRTPDELSVVVESSHVPPGVTHEGPFATFMVEGPLDFNLTGILARLTAPLATAAIPVFVMSTFDTDYVLVREPLAPAAVSAWTRAGVSLTDE